MLVLFAIISTLTQAPGDACDPTALPCDNTASCDVCSTEGFCVEACARPSDAQYCASTWCGPTSDTEPTTFECKVNDSNENILSTICAGVDPVGTTHEAFGTTFLIPVTGDGPNNPDGYIFCAIVPDQTLSTGYRIACQQSVVPRWMLDNYIGPNFCMP